MIEPPNTPQRLYYTLLRSLTLCDALWRSVEALWSVMRLCEAFRGSITLFYALCGSVGLCEGCMNRFEALLRSPTFSEGQ